MRIYSFNGEPGVITGQENNPDLFIRKTIFPTGYAESDYHHHPNSYEFYVILKGKLVFESENKDRVEATAGDLVYFEMAEPHRIVQVDEVVEMLLIKRLGATKDIGYKPSKEQLKQLEILFELIDKCKEKGIEIWIVGGYGLDALYGSLTRDHGDIDLIVWEKDLLAVEKIVEEMGFVGDIDEAEKNKKVYRPKATVAVDDTFKIEFGSVEFYGQFFPKETPLGSLVSKNENGVIMGKVIKTLTLKGHKITAEVQNQRAVRSNWGEYKHQKHFEKMISILDRKKLQ